MNPNPYRTALLALALLGLAMGGLFLLIAATSSDVSIAVTLGAVGGFLISTGSSLLILWIAVSALLHGLTTTPKVVDPTPNRHWLAEAEKPSVPPTPVSHFDEDGL